MLKIDNLKKSYSVDDGTVEALRGVSLEVSERDFFTFLGLDLFGFPFSQ